MTCMVLNTFTARLHRLVGSKSKAAAAAAKEKRNSQSLQISAPFNFKHESISLPGLSEDDIATLKKKAAASRLGVGDTNDDGSSAFGSPRKAPRAPPSPARAAAPAVLVTPGTPLSPADNVF
ncbi:hypothetical protein F5B21DRAFT_154159 [Xylaria acuta]|nr:hypothetical protein F5B21DRAFT_154159 [Xylaria acuta]